MTKKQLGLMKKIFKYMFAVVAGVAALAACTNEPDDNIKPEEQNGGLTIVASMGDATKTIMADGEGIKWEESDNFVAWYVDPAAEKPYSYDLREEKTPTSITEDGYKATLTLEKAPVGGYLWLSYGSNAAYDGTSAAKVEFNYKAAQTQATPGVANKEYMRLVGEKIAVEENGEYTAKMEVVGTIMRFIVYSSNGTYANENVKSVQLVSADKNIAGAGSAIAYNFADFYNTEAGRKWHTSVANQFSDECEIFWDATSKIITTTLTNTFKPAADAASSKGNGVYMFVPPVKVGGYKYIVETNEARYIFDASTIPTEFTTNTIKNVTLDLEHEKATRMELSSVKGDLQYIGDLNAALQKLSYTGVNEKDGGYWYAQTRDTGADWVTKEGAANAAYYTGVVFECIDNATGEEADWLHVYYKTDGSTHWWINADPQVEGAPERSATVTATFPDVDGYLVTEACKTKTITVTQMEYSIDKIITFKLGPKNESVTSEAQTWDNGYIVVQLNGSDLEDNMAESEEAQMLYDCIRFECHDMSTGLGAGGPIVDWFTIEYQKNGEGKYSRPYINVTATENTSAQQRRVLVLAKMAAPDGYKFQDGTKDERTLVQFELTQAGAAVGGGDEGGDEPVIVEGMSYTIFNNAADGSNGTGFTKDAYSGDWYRFENITINGKTYTPGAEIDALANNEALMAQLMAKAFSFGEITEEDVQVPGADPLTTNPESFVTLEAWSNGGAAIYVRMVITANDSGARRTFKIITKDGEGNQVSSIVYFQNA